MSALGPLVDIPARSHGFFICQRRVTDGGKIGVPSVRELLPQISTSLFGSSSRLSAPGGKCSASTAPHRPIAATKPSAGRPCFTPAISASIAASTPAASLLS